MESSLKTTNGAAAWSCKIIYRYQVLIDKGERDAALKHLAKMTDVYDDKKQYLQRKYRYWQYSEF